MNMWLANNAKVITTDGRKGRLRVTRRVRKLIGEGKVMNVNIVFKEHVKTYKSNEVSEYIEEVKECAIQCEDCHRWMCDDWRAA